MGWKPIEFLPSSVSKLGTAEATFQWAVSVLLFRCFFAVVSCLFGLLVLSMNIGLALDEPEKAIRIVLRIAVGLGCLAAGILGLRNNYLRRQVRVMVFADALLIVEHNRFISILWAEVEAVCQESVHYKVHGVPVGSDYVYRIDLGHGEQVTVAGDLENIGNLGPIIQQRTGKTVAQSRDSNI